MNGLGPLAFVGPAAPFAPLPTIAGGWPCLVVDAPLHFSTRSAKGQGRAPSQHYKTLSPASVMTLPLETVAAADAWLFLWWPDPHLVRLLEVMQAFGFALSGKAFTWIKTLDSLARSPRLISSDDIESVLTIGTGFTTRKNSESCWLGRRGKPAISSHAVRGVIIAPRREHSRKPAAFYERAARFCPGPRLDVFGRESRDEWTVWGDEIAKFDGEHRGAAA